MKRPRTTKELGEFKTAQNMKLYPNLPKSAVARGSFKDNSANELTKCIIYDIEEVVGGLALRINNTGIYDPKTKRFRKAHTRRGIPDIVGVVNGRFLGIEVKYGKDRMSEYQKEMREDIEAAGGIYFVAKSYAGYVEAIEHLLQ